MLAKTDDSVGRVIELQVPDKVLTERITGRHTLILPATSSTSSSVLLAFILDLTQSPFLKQRRCRHSYDWSKGYRYALDQSYGGPSPPFFQKQRLGVNGIL